VRAGPTAGAGIRVDLAELIAMRLAAYRFERASRKRVVGSRGAAHASRLRGRGVDYAESRNYQPGDDIRQMDWRVTARTGRPHTKLFQEERERNVLLVVSHNPSMHFGTRVRFKSVQAARFAALVAWAATMNGDRIGAIGYGPGLNAEVKPGGGARGALRVLRALREWDAIAAQGHSVVPLSQALQRAQRLTRPGSQIVPGVVKAVEIKGHTPGHSGYLIGSGSDTDGRKLGGTAGGVANAGRATGSPVDGVNPGTGHGSNRDSATNAADAASGPAGGMVFAAVDPVEADARHEQPFPSLAIDQAEALDGGNLAQQAQGLDAASVAGRFRPWQLHGPAQLVADAFDEVLDLHGGQPGFRIQQVVQPGALVAIAEPRLAAARDQQRRDDGPEQDEEVSPEQRRARVGDGRPAAHSRIRSALPRSELGKDMPSGLAAFMLMNSSTLVTRCTGRSDGFSPLRMRPAYMPVWRCDWWKSPP